MSNPPLVRLPSLSSDVRTQRLVRVQFRADVLAVCNTSLLLLLDGLVPGSLLLADLGYFSFPWFDSLSGQSYFWVSRLKDNVRYDLKEVFAYDDAAGLLDAVIRYSVLYAPTMLVPQ